MLLEACKIIYKKKIKIIMIGEGPLKSKMYNFNKTNGLKNYVKFLPSLDKKKIFNLINKSKILALPSNFETFGIVAIEAYSLGVPVVMTDSLGVRDLFNPKSSILVHKKNPEIFAKALKYLLINYKNFKSKQIIKYYKKIFHLKL